MRDWMKRKAWRAQALCSYLTAFLVLPYRTLPGHVFEPSVARITRFFCRDLTLTVQEGQRRPPGSGYMEDFRGPPGVSKGLSFFSRTYPTFDRPSQTAEHVLSITVFAPSRTTPHRGSVTPNRRVVPAKTGDARGPRPSASSSAPPPRHAATD